MEKYYIMIYTEEGISSMYISYRINNTDNPNNPWSQYCSDTEDQKKD